MEESYLIIKIKQITVQTRFRMLFFNKIYIRTALCCSALVLITTLHAQPYQSFFTGDTSDVSTPTKGGIVLSGGAGEVDAAMRWFLQQSGGGDIVVLRASGDDGYNDYLFSELGIPINSIQTFVLASTTAANDPYVVHQIRQAEGLWIAGGDQADYINWWKDSPVETALHYLIHDKKAPMGGISAGMAVQGSAYFSALHGGVTSQEALNNPYNNRVTLGNGDFLDHPDLQGVITDTHYDDPDRRGRHVTFLARLVQDFGYRAKGIACEEFTAVCIDSAGQAQVFGGYPQSIDYAYFLQANCAGDFTPEVCTPGQPLHWQRNNAAVVVYRIPGRSDGSGTFNLRDWQTGSGGTWQNWWVEQGVLKTQGGAAEPACTTPTRTPGSAPVIRLFPNPASAQVHVVLGDPETPAVLEVFDSQGKTVAIVPLNNGAASLATATWPAGGYFFRIKTAAGTTVAKVQVR